jgi:hypothetical protein
MEKDVPVKAAEDILIPGKSPVVILGSKGAGKTLPFPQG